MATKWKVKEDTIGGLNPHLKPGSFVDYVCSRIWRFYTGGISFALVTSSFDEHGVCHDAIVSGQFLKWTCFDKSVRLYSTQADDPEAAAKKHAEDGFNSWLFKAELKQE